MKTWAAEHGRVMLITLELSRLAETITWCKPDRLAEEVRKRHDAMLEVLNYSSEKIEAELSKEQASDKSRFDACFPDR